MSYFKVYDKQEKCYLEPIYRGYEGKIFDFYLGISGTLTFRCEGMQDKGFPNGYTHESIITQGKDRFEIIFDNQNEKIEKDKLKPIPPPPKVVYDEGDWFSKKTE